MNADGSDQVQLTFEEAFESSLAPSWSPDGSQIAFTSDREVDWEIFIMNADGSGQTNITGPNQSLSYDDKNPDWSPDGTRIVFEGVREGAWEILTADPDGTDEVNLTAEDDPPWTNINGYASYRPDGSKIVYMSQVNDGSEDWDVWVMNPDGTDKENVSPTTSGRMLLPDGPRTATRSSSTRTARSSASTCSPWTTLPWRRVRPWPLSPRVPSRSGSSPRTERAGTRIGGHRRPPYRVAGE
jgi:Tol biopolymer transport system component